MADFPDDVVSFRTPTNRTGVTFDAAITDRLYAEDVIKIEDEIVAIENELGAGGGAWSNLTPTISVSGGTAPTYVTVFVSRFRQIGKTVFCEICWLNASGGVAGAGTSVLLATLPVTAKSFAAGVFVCVGSGQSYSTGGYIGIVNVVLHSTTTFKLFKTEFASMLGNNQSGSEHDIMAFFSYEAA